MNGLMAIEGRLPSMNSQTEMVQESLPLARATLERWSRTTPAILHAIDSEGCLIAVSDAWLAKLGYSREEALGRKSSDFLTPESRLHAVREVLPAFFAAGRMDNVSFQMVCKDGRVIDVLMSAVLDPSDIGHGCCSLAVITDVTELRIAQRKLAESQALYEGIVESQTELVSLAKPDGELCYVNQAYARNYSLEPHELVGTNLLDYVPTEARGEVMEHIKRVCDAKATIESENQVVTADGQTRWIGWTNRAIVDSDGRVVAIHSVGRDIDRRVVAEQRLKASEARYRILADHSSDMVILVRVDGQRVYVSPACQKILGWSQEEMLTLTTQDSVHPEDLSKLQHSFAEGQDAVMMLTYRVRRKDGDYTWVEAATQRVELPGEMPHRLLIVRDISGRIESERELKESEAKYRLLAENSGDMVLQLDRDLVRRYVSPACRDIIGYEPSELLGDRALDHCHPDDLAHVVKTCRALLAGEADRQTLVTRTRHRDGRWVWVEIEAKAVKDPATGEVTGIVGAVRDISKRRAIEDQLAEATRQLEILAAQDGLTGLANRRAFDEALDREFRSARREGENLALVMIDVDRFKSFNDRYGHPAGDACLKQIASTIGGAIRRPRDLAARYGGEEFVVLLPNTHEAGAAEIAERIRLAVRALGLANEAGVNGAVTISAGVVSWPKGADGDRAGALLKAADRALYLAKNAGRDLVCNASWMPDDEPEAADARRREIA